MALTARTDGLASVLGENANLAMGVAGGSGTSTTVTIPQMKTVKGAVTVSGTATNATAVTATSTNTFTVSHTSAEVFAYIAWGDARM